jgi:hypothetical protein
MAAFSYLNVYYCDCPPYNTSSVAAAVETMLPQSSMPRGTPTIANSTSVLVCNDDWPLAGLLLFFTVMILIVSLVT